MSKFKVAGHVGLVDTAKEVQKLLGGNVKMKDILAGTLPNVTLVEDGDVDQFIADTTAPDPTGTGATIDESGDQLHQLTDEGITDEAFMSDVPEHKQAQLARDAADEAEVAKALAAKGVAVTPPTKPTGKEVGDIEYPEVGSFADKKAMKKYVKKLSDVQVYDWLDLEGVIFTPCDHEAINRMRAIMALTAKHFPVATPTATKSKSKYASYTDEQLIQMAIDKNIKVADHKGDSRIRRMYTIMALKAAGHLA